MTDQQETGRDLSAEDIFAAADQELLPVRIPEWRGTVYIRVLPADEGLELNEKMQALPKDKQPEAMFLLLNACLVDAAGKRLFQTEEQQAKLRTRSQKVLLRLNREALKHQGWLEEGPAKNA